MTKPDAGQGGTVLTRFLAVVLAVVLWSALARADEAPISGTVKAVDAGAQTVTLESTAKGKTRQVVVHLKPGWIISVEAKHEGGKEVADVVKVVLER